MIILRAEKGDLQKILDLQYIAYQSEARLFKNQDIPPLKQTLADVEKKLGYKIFDEKKVTEELRFVYMEKY